MAQQRTFPCWSDAGDLLQSGLADVLLAFLAVRTDRETVRLVAQPLHEIQHRIARLELDRLAADGTIRGWALWAAIVILCREILVSGLREYLAELRVSVPVTALAKWKTFLQLVAVGFLIAGEAGDQILPVTTLTGVVLLWLSAILTLYTGWDYFRAGVRHLIDD